MRPTDAVRALIIACVWAVTLSPVGASAKWLANGTAVMPGFLDGSNSVSIAPDLAGGAYAVTGDGTYDAKVNHLLGTGDFAAGWNSQGALFSTGPFRPFVPILIADGVGGAFVISNSQNCAAHCTNDPTELRVQHMTLDGKLVEGWPLEGMSIGSGL